MLELNVVRCATRSPWRYPHLSPQPHLLLCSGSCLQWHFCPHPSLCSWRSSLTSFFSSRGFYGAGTWELFAQSSVPSLGSAPVSDGIFQIIKQIEIKVEQNGIFLKANFTCRRIAITATTMSRRISLIGSIFAADCDLYSFLLVRIRKHSNSRQIKATS